MKIIRNVLFCGVGVALSLGLLNGCGGGGGTSINDGVTLRCADGTAVQQNTRERAEAACATRGGVTPTP